MDHHTVMGGNFNIPSSPIDRQKERNNRVKSYYKSNGQGNLLNSLPKQEKIHFFSSMAHGTYRKVDHILGHKASPNTGKKIKITPWFLSDHGLKLEINKSRNSRKYANSQKLNSLLNKKKRIQTEREIKNLLELNENEMKAQHPQSCGKQRRQP